MDRMRPTLKCLCLLVNSVNPENPVNPVYFFCPNVGCFDLALSHRRATDTLHIQSTATPCQL